MGFRNPFRLQVDENDVAYVTDYSPDAQTPQRSRGPSGVGPHGDRPPSGELRLPDLLHARTSATTAGTSASSPRARRRSARRWTTRRSRSTAARTRSINDSRWVRDGGPGFEPGLRELPPITNPDIWYSYRDNNTASPLGTPCFGYYATTPGRDRAGLDDRVPAAVPGALHGRRGAARRGQVPLRPGQPERPRSSRPTTTTRSSWASTRRTRCVRSSWTPRTGSSRSTASWTAARRTSPTRRSTWSATTRWTSSSAPTARCT